MCRVILDAHSEEFYRFMEECREDGLTPEDAIYQWEEIQNERRERFIERYENDPMVHEGWHQQDLIDMYRRER